MFNIFKGLNLENSLAYARLATQKIREKKTTGPEVSQIKETYAALQEDEKDRSKRVVIGRVNNVKPLEQARGILGDLKRQKRALSYNPYKVSRWQDASDFTITRNPVQR